MTKQEKIEEAWGRHWNEYKNFIDGDGFINNEDLGDSLFVLYGKFDKFYYNDSLYWRPKSLSDIENNNEITETRNVI